MANTLAGAAGHVDSDRRAELGGQDTGRGEITAFA
jgi:hypothetical protein